jgi:hypothetical protein
LSAADHAQQETEGGTTGSQEDIVV